MTSPATPEVQLAAAQPDSLNEPSLALPSWHGLGADAGSRRARRVLLAILGLLLAAMTITDFVLVRSADQGDAMALSRAEALAETKTRLPDLLGYSSNAGWDLARANQNTTGRFHEDYAKVLTERRCAERLRAEDQDAGRGERCCRGLSNRAQDRRPGLPHPDHHGRGRRPDNLR